MALELSSAGSRPCGGDGCDVVAAWEDCDGRQEEKQVPSASSGQALRWAKDENLIGTLKHRGASVVKWRHLKNARK